MASDLKIEIFAYYFYHCSWQIMGVKVTELNIFHIYGDECIKVDNYSEACFDIYNAEIYCRWLLYSKKYSKEIDVEKAIGCKCLSEFYDYVSCTCDRDDLFGHLTIFERMLATSCFVLNLCISIHSYCLIDVVKYGHIIWAMYFDKFTDTFYEEGGWNELRRTTQIYLPLSDFFHFFKPEGSYMHALKNASVNYCQFKMAFKKYNCEYKLNERFHFSNLWIKFHLKHFKEYVRYPLGYQDSADCLEIEKLLQDLKFISNCSWNYNCNYFKIFQEGGQGAICSTGMLSAKASDNCEEIKTDENICIENLKTNKKLRYSFPHSEKVLETPLENAFSSSSEKKPVNEIKCKTQIQMMGNVSDGFLERYLPKRCNNLHETSDTKFDTNIEYSPPNADKNETEWPIKNTLNNLYNNLQTEIEFSSKNEVPEISNEDIPEIEVKPNVRAKNEEICNEDNKVSSTLSTNETSGTQCKKNAMTKSLSSSNDFLAVNGIKKNKNESIKSIEELNKLKEEQNDPDIRNFLRMILVLGDKQGIQYVCGTLRSRKGQNNSQIKSNKRKKRSKPKSKGNVS